MKHPSVRTASCADWLPETHARIRDIVIEFIGLLPFQADDVAITGSNALGTATFHSDLDLHIETGTPERREAAIEAMRNNDEQMSKAVNMLKWAMWTEFGYPIQRITMDEPSVADNPKKVCYRIVDRQWFHTNAKTKVVFDTNVKDFVPMKPKPAPKYPPRYIFTGTDPDTGNLIPWKDDYDWCLDDWRTRLNGKMLEIGTVDTKHLNPTTKRDQYVLKSGIQNGK